MTIQCKWPPNVIMVGKILDAIKTYGFSEDDCVSLVSFLSIEAKELIEDIYSAIELDENRVDVGHEDNGLD